MEITTKKKWITLTEIQKEELYKLAIHFGCTNISDILRMVISFGLKAHKIPNLSNINVAPITDSAKDAIIILSVKQLHDLNLFRYENGYNSLKEAANYIINIGIHIANNIMANYNEIISEVENYNTLELEE